MPAGEPARRRPASPAPAAAPKRAASAAPALVLRDARLFASAAALDETTLQRAAALGFNGALLGGSAGPLRADAPQLDAVAALASAARRQAMGLMLEIDLHRLGADALVQSHPHWFRSDAEADFPLDPRRDANAREFLPRFEHPPAAQELGRRFAALLTQWLEAGAAGFLVHWPQRVPAPLLRSVIDAAKRARPDAVFVAAAAGLTRPQRLALAHAGFDAALCSLPWWDFRAPWFADELADLRGIGDVVAPFELRPESAADERAQRALQRALAFAAATVDAWLCRLPALDDAVPKPLADALTRQNRLISGRGRRNALRVTSAPWSRVGAWRDGEHLLLVSSDLDHHLTVPEATLAEIGSVDADATRPLAPGEVRLLTIARAAPVVQASGDRELKAAIAAPRVQIEALAPSADEPRFAVKRTLGEALAVEADVFADGHPTLSVRLLWRAADENEWQAVRMRALGNDRWRAEFTPRRLGAHEFTIEAGLDEFGSLRSDLEKKRRAGQPVALEIEEARQLIERAARRAPEALRGALRRVLHDLASDADPAARLLSPDCAERMAQALPPAFAARAPVHHVFVERRAARFASWYELFPRSQGKPGRHGTLRDVVAQLPRIAAMGFDVLYFTPIHPIGNAHRKGRNNSLRAEPGDPGSPYAIGAAEGGHDAVHPELGTLEDFRALVDAARRHGIEIALDFAVQCSPDHPWIAQHPEWFAWRPDGTLRYAENPPKKYEDIVNVDFYAKGSKPGLWLALRDVIAFWMRQGVKTFRVDNPHTKPLPFWEWLIADLRARDPEVIFLSEAFTRPKLMYRLAKLGFAQSYTYFTWRNTRAELTAYLNELNAAPQRDFFRPHFFVNTPDINPTFLHHAGRAGFLIRAALATTLSGLWGMYSGFELCESAALDGKEEYLDSEKYELRARDWNAPGNIAAEIGALNRLRRENPALQSHLGVTFHNSSNPAVIWFAKATPTRDNVVLVAVNLDPHAAQESSVELPLWEFGLDDGGALCAEDLLDGHAFDWRGKVQQIRLDPRQPYRLWRVRAPTER